MCTINPKNLNLYLKLLSSLSTFCLFSLIGYKIYTYSPFDYSNFSYDKNDIANIIENLQVKDPSKEVLSSTKELKASIEEERLITNQQQLLEDRRINQQNLLEDRREHRRQMLEDRNHHNNEAFYNTLKNTVIAICILGGCFYVGYVLLYGGGGGGGDCAQTAVYSKDLAQNGLKASEVTNQSVLEASSNISKTAKLMVHSNTQQALSAASTENSVIISDGGGVRAAGNEVAQVPDMVREEDII